MCVTGVQTWDCVRWDVAQELIHCYDGKFVYAFVHMEVKLMAF